MEKRNTDYTCGLLCFRSQSLQPLGNVKCFVGVFSLIGFSTWPLYSFLVSHVTNIEKAFGLSSSESGWLFTVWEFGYIFCLIWSAYISARAHIPKVLGFATIMCATTALLQALPHFVAFNEETFLSMNATETDSELEKAQKSLCGVQGDDGIKTENSKEKTEPAKEISGKVLAFALFNIAMILQGVSKAPCYPYSAQYIDDNGKKEHTGFYAGIIACVSICGLTVGYGVGSLTNQMYVTLEDTTLDTTDSRFIGAWWLGFICFAVVIYIVGFTMLCFPKMLRTNEHFNDSVDYKGKTRKERTGIMVLFKEFKGMVSNVFMIIKNPIYILTLTGCCLQTLSLACYQGFEPKYLQKQFAMPAWQTNIVIGATSIGAFAIGSLISGIVSKKFNMGPFATLRYLLVIYSLCVVLQAIVIGIGCPIQEIVNPLEDSDFRLSSTPAATAPCDCTQDQFLPICGNDQRVYFSPCHAGCTSGTVKTFSNCTFIPGGEAKAGMCPTDCKLMWVFSAIKFVINLLDAIVSIPAFIVFLRSAGEERKAFALAISAVAGSLLAWMPGPVMGGSLIDSTCLIWTSGATSGEYCAHYDLVLLRHRLNGTMLGIRIAGVLLIGGAMFKARKVLAWPTSETPDEDQTEMEMVDKK